MKERNVECPKCHKRFRGQKGLKMHIRDVHEGSSSKKIGGLQIYDEWSDMPCWPEKQAEAAE